MGLMKTRPNNGFKLMVGDGFAADWRPPAVS